MSQNHGDRKRTGRFSLLSSLSSALIETSQRALEEHLHENTLQRRRGTAEAAPERLPGPAQQQQQQEQQQEQQQQQQLVQSDDPSGTEAIVAQAPPESPYASGDPAKLSISYLARISSEVYQSHENRNETGGGGAPAKVHEVGTADCFSVVVSQTPRNSNSGSNESNNETKKTLCVAVRGTFSPLQHVMNVMPHAFRGLHVIGEALSSETKGCEKTGRTRTSRDAYREGHHEGWIEPARAIYQKLGELCLGSSGSDWNREFDRIVLTGHSRGGLLAVHVGEFFAGLRDPLGGGISGAEAPAPPFGGLLRVVAFGMPPPLGAREDGGKGLSTWHACHVLSVWNKNDPVANGSVLNGGPSWKPLSLAVGSPVPPPKRQREFASQQPPQPQNPPQNHRPAKPPPPLGGWSGMLGALGSAVSTVAEAVGDTASDLASCIEDHHPASEYALLVSEGRPGDPGELPGGVGVDPSSRELVLELL